MAIAYNVYPNTGRSLTLEDVGQKVVRTYPFVNNGSYSFDCFPFLNCYTTLMQVMGDKVIIKAYGNCFEVPNDNNWLLCSEYQAKIQGKVFETLLFTPNEKHVFSIKA